MEINGSSSQLPWFKPEPHADDLLRPDGAWPHHLSARALEKQVAYDEGSTIDWFREEAAERERKLVIRSRRGLLGLTGMVLDSAGMWLVVVLTGVGIGIMGAWLDVLVRWLGDLREGRCSYGFFYNQVACCSGLDPGEICREWQTWSEYLHVSSIFGQSLLHAVVYIALSILSGYVFDAFLGPWVLLIKALGLALAVASGLSLGKEGPLVHVACCWSFLMSRILRQGRQTEARKRKLLAAAAASGVSVAFGSPLGGVLFGLEELDTFANDSDAMWRGFVTSVIAAVSLQYVDPFGTSKLVLFQVSETGSTWRGFELIPWVFLSVVGGLIGSLLIKLNTAAAVYRRNSILNDHPIIESSELVANLFQECDTTKTDYHGLCNPTALGANVFLLVLTAIVKVGFTAWTFGMMIPAGIFLPTITIGACLGRAVGLITQGLLDILLLPPDPTVRCISPGFYAVIGASAALGGVTRMTISLVVILFELTGALSHVLPIMISVMLAKWVGDALGRDGIYAAWIALRQYPWLSASRAFRDAGETAARVMKPARDLACVRDRCAVRELAEVVARGRFRAFPVVGQGEILLGLVTREKVRACVDLIAEDPNVERLCTFVPPGSGESEDGAMVNLSWLLEEAVLQLRKDVPLELVVDMFQKMNLRHILFSQEGKLVGMVTKTDIVWLLTGESPHAGALSERQ
ncbi:chloride channel [Epithele typhae]|uniref:chloride channel n=1 Tax=Epithele typhae TaxID=378194 RepID=UPI0020076936|nr:chloride channel [Epithele typhae]KAH9913990.1 chloride channel [Epithele typhae]